jgi:hypothetical protein
MMLNNDFHRRVRELRAAGRSPKQVAWALSVRPATLAPLVRTRLRLPRRRVLPRGEKRTRTTDHQRADLPAFLRRFFTPFDKVSAPLAALLELARHLVWGAVDYAGQLGFEPAPDFELAAGHLRPWQQTSAITFGRHGVPFYVAGPFDNPARVIRVLTSSVGGATSMSSRKSRPQPAGDLRQQSRQRIAQRSQVPCRSRCLRGSRSACAGDLGDRSLPINPEIFTAPRKPSAVIHELTNRCLSWLMGAVPSVTPDVVAQARSVRRMLELRVQSPLDDDYPATTAEGTDDVAAGDARCSGHVPCTVPVPVAVVRRHTLPLRAAEQQPIIQARHRRISHGARSGTVASQDDQLRKAVLMRHRRQYRVPAPRSSFSGFRFPPDAIMLAVLGSRWMGSAAGSSPASSEARRT